MFQPLRYMSTEELRLVFRPRPFLKLHFQNSQLSTLFENNGNKNNPVSRDSRRVYISTVETIVTQRCIRSQVIRHRKQQQQSIDRASRDFRRAKDYFSLQTSLLLCCTMSTEPCFTWRCAESRCRPEKLYTRGSSLLGMIDFRDNKSLRWVH